MIKMIMDNDRYLDLRINKNYEQLIIPAQIIKEGKIVVFPTETVYGIGTNGFKTESIEKLYKIKERPINKPISLLVSDIKMIESIADDITDIEYKLIKAFFPGPLTIILKKRKNIPNSLTANMDTVGVRMPRGEVARKLIEYSGVPIATTSANVSGKKSGTNVENIMNEFGKKVDYYIDGGESEIGIGSTVVKIDKGEPIILRQGTITMRQIKDVM